MITEIGFEDGMNLLIENEWMEQPPLAIHFLTDGKEKYIWYSHTGEEQLFNLEHDRKELTNFANRKECAHLLHFWRERLIGELLGREDGFTDVNRLIAGRKTKACLDKRIRNHLV